MVARRKDVAWRLASLAARAEAGWGWAFLACAAAALAHLVVGFLIDRHSARTIFLLVTGLQAPLFLVAMNLAGVPALVTALGFMLLVFGQIPINDVLIARISKSEWRSRAFAGRLIVGFGRSDERRVGKACVSTCRSRWSPAH